MSLRLTVAQRSGISSGGRLSTDRKPVASGLLGNIHGLIRHIDQFIVLISDTRVEVSVLSNILFDYNDNMIQHPCRLLASDFGLILKPLRVQRNHSELN